MIELTKYPCCVANRCPTQESSRRKPKRKLWKMLDKITSMAKRGNENWISLKLQRTSEMFIITCTIKTPNRSHESKSISSQEFHSKKRNLRETNS
jgi:hypothetical protein